MSRAARPTYGYRLVVADRGGARAGVHLVRLEQDGARALAKAVVLP